MNFKEVEDLRTAKRKGDGVACGLPLPLRGGPHDGGQVHPIGCRFSEPIYVSGGFMNKACDGRYVTWSEERNEVFFPAAYAFNQGAQCFDFWGWDNWKQ